MSYGTQAQVATMASTWTNDGVWVNPSVDYPGSVEPSNPTLDEVEVWLDQVSAQFNVALGSHAFVAPINPATSPNSYKAISQYVVQVVADLCSYKNSSGRFFTEKLVERGVTPMAAILKDINNWIEMNADGLAADGVPQVSIPSIRKQPIFLVIGNLKGSKVE